MICIKSSKDIHEIGLLKSILDSQDINSYVKGSDLDLLKSVLPYDDTLIHLYVSENDLLKALFILKIPINEEIFSLFNDEKNKYKRNIKDQPNNPVSSKSFGNINIYISFILSFLFIYLLILYFSVSNKYEKLDKILNSEEYVYSDFSSTSSCISDFFKHNDRILSKYCYKDDGLPLSVENYDIKEKLVSYYFKENNQLDYDRFIEYDINKIKTIEGYDTNLDGRYDKIIYFDRFGKEIRVETDSDHNGRIEKSEIIYK